jgi:hypothetical protein
MNYKKSFQILVVILLLAFLLVSCGSPKAGTVTGTLVTASGDPPAEEYSIVLCKVVTDTSNCTLDTKHQTVTVNGKFSIKGAPVGHYAILIASESTQKGMFLLRDNGVTLVIILEKNKDFDLGTVTLK